MRFAAYAGASTALATGVILHAFNQRPNYYSALVYLAQSQACRMILLNLVLLSAYTFVRALQKALYGPLRAIEREQLWDKSWYAITETALAMTMFRDEVGVYFMVMFVSLLAGKIWAWISEGRVEILEQQPPANPRLFHGRMLVSLFISELFDLVMLRYCVNTLISQPRPGMMVMFAFEFAVLFITSSSVTLRYGLALYEIVEVKKQTQAKVQERRDEIRAARQEADRQSEGGNERPPPVLEREEDVDENDIDVPGWEAKGKWILFLDLFTDFMKLVVYMFFFAMLLLFHGIPIHIIRDVYLTMRSFLKRISDFQKYKNATRDMNARYPDATAQELERDGTCIICREDMRPWQQPPAEPIAPRRPGQAAPDERQRPKKLPCGHILHLGCLKSWLERQQVCPTCRTSVLARDQSRGAGGGVNQLVAAHGNFVQGVPAVNNGAAAGQHNENPQQANNNPGVRARQFRLGPWRFTFAAGEAGQIRDTLRQLNQRQPAPNQAQNNGGNAAESGNLPGVNSLFSSPTGNVYQQLQDLENSILQEIQRLQVSEHQLQGVRRLQLELTRLRLQQMTLQSSQGNSSNQHLYQHPQTHQPQIPQYQYHQPQTHRQFQAWQPTIAPPTFVPAAYYPPPAFGPGSYGMPPQFQAGAVPLPGFATTQQSTSIGPGHADLPAGLNLPEGWSAVPLQRLGAVRPDAGPSAESQDPFNIQLPAVLQQTAERAPSLQQHASAPVPQAAQTEPMITAEPPASSSNGVSTTAHPNAQDGASSSSWKRARETSEMSPETSHVPDWSSTSEQTNGIPITTDQPAVGSSTALGPPPAPQSDSTPSSTGSGKSRAARVEDTVTEDKDCEEAGARRIP